jgi:type II restriction/modification system DNA methylase subunit YeeA
MRAANSRKVYAERWWIHAEARPDMREALKGLSRYIATPRVSKHRIFAWLDAAVLPDCQLIVFAREDDAFFGLLHSHIHEVWALGQGTQLREKESGFRYTPTTCFETFPLPAPDEEKWGVIASAAQALDAARSNWLGDRSDKTRTLTNLYNERPAWLDMLHRALDEAVAAAYGWEWPLSDDEILRRLFELNQARARR